MNFDQFAADFRNPEGSVPCGEQTVPDPAVEVTIASTILSVTKDLCCVEINGTQYEISSRDIIEIGDLVPPVAGELEGKKEEGAEAELKAGPRLVAIKLPANAILYTKVAVSAALISTVGTWVTVVPQEAQAA